MPTGSCFFKPCTQRGVPYMSQEKEILRDFVYRVVNFCIYNLISSVGTYLYFRHRTEN